MNEFWFKPKLYGYGATPVTWEGWAVTAIYAALVVACIVFASTRERSWPTSFAAIAVATGVMVALAWFKTDGVWQWRWGHLEHSEKAS